MPISEPIASTADIVTSLLDQLSLPKPIHNNLCSQAIVQIMTDSYPKKKVGELININNYPKHWRGGSDTITINEDRLSSIAQAALTMLKEQTGDETLNEAITTYLSKLSW